MVHKLTSEGDGCARRVDRIGVDSDGPIRYLSRSLSFFFFSIAKLCSALSVCARQAQAE